MDALNQRATVAKIAIIQKEDWRTGEKAIVSVLETVQVEYVRNLHILQKSKMF